MFFYTVLFRCRKKLQAKEKQLPAEKTNTSYNFYVRGFSGLEGRQKLCTLECLRFLLLVPYYKFRDVSKLEFE